MARASIYMERAQREYLLSASLREPEVLSRLREASGKLPQAECQICPEQGQFMGVLMQMLQAKRTLEIGVFCGYSTLWVALALPVDGEIVACDVSEEWTNIGRPFWKEAGVAEKIDLRIAPAAETLQKLLDEGQAGAFDFAFIDADKTNNDRYYELALKLVRPHGVIGVDNTLWHGRAADPAAQDPETIAIRAFNQKLRCDERVSISLLPIGDGLTLAWKRG